MKFTITLGNDRQGTVPEVVAADAVQYLVSNDGSRTISAAIVEDVKHNLAWVTITFSVDGMTPHQRDTLQRQLERMGRVKDWNLN